MDHKGGEITSQLNDNLIYDINIIENDINLNVYHSQHQYIYIYAIVLGRGINSDSMFLIMIPLVNSIQK